MRPHAVTSTSQGDSFVYNGSYAIVPVGTQYKDGTWRELNRELDADLQAVFGVGVEYVKWFCIRGDYDLDDLRLLDEGEATRYYLFPSPASGRRNGGRAAKS